MDALSIPRPKEISVTLKASSFFYDEETDCYRVKFTESDVISHDKLKKTIILSIPSAKVQTNSQTQQLKDEDIDSILDEIAGQETHIKKKQIMKKLPQDEENKSLHLEKKEMESTSKKEKQIINSVSHKLSSIPNPRANNNKQNKKIKLSSNMQSEWSMCCSGNEEDCDGSSVNECVALKRISFILEHYSSWIKYKSLTDDQDSDDDSSDGDSSDGGSNIDIKTQNELIMRSYEWISDLFIELQFGRRDNNNNNNANYTYINLCDDFEHIRDFHMKLNKSKTSITIEYFDKLLGKCIDKECCSLARHCRDRHIDNINENKRRQIFFIKKEIEKDVKKENNKSNKKIITKQNTVKENRMYFEINLQTKLDTIHITLRHHHLRLINTDKFITKISSLEQEQQEQQEEERERREKDEIYCSMSKYSFGESITYWDNKHHRYCNSKYADLRSELLNNKIYSLSYNLYSTIKTRAISFLQTKKGIKLLSLREHDWMKKWKILLKSQITCDHIIALLCYVNVTALRRVFKLHGFYRRKNKTNESREILLERHREIWHWSRLLLECVHCYGNVVNCTRNYYHGIDCKLLFNRFNVMFDIPTSLTLNRDIAYNLSKTINYGRGIAIELSHGGLSDLQSLCIDLSLLSDYPSEEEQLIFHSYLSFNDIIINRMHHDEWLKILRFWYKIKEGFFFNHLIDTNIITRNDQLCICAMIINMIISDQKHERYDNRIPKYMQLLFNECVENNTFVWIIKTEYTKMIKKLQNLLDINSQFIKYLIKYKKCNVCNANVFNWKIKNSQFIQLFSNINSNSNQKKNNKSSNTWIKSPKYTIYLNDKPNNNYLQFHFEAQNKYKNGLFRCRIHLDYKPKNICKINLGMGLFCKYANNFDNYSYGELRYDKLYNVSLHSLFKTKLLKKNLDKLSLKEFNLKLQIQLFYIYDFNGKLIKINQSQLPQQQQYFE